MIELLQMVASLTGTTNDGLGPGVSHPIFGAVILPQMNAIRFAFFGQPRIIVNYINHMRGQKSSNPLRKVTRLLGGAIFIPELDNIHPTLHG
jgi:hypothetical protein